jgi:predicted DNA-binding transcriptional regulator AlpA
MNWSMLSQLDIDDALISRYLSRFLGRRYLRYSELEELGLIPNRTTLKSWMDEGGFPRGIRIPGPAGKTLVWHAVEIARLIAQRVEERDDANREGPSGEDGPF